MKAEFDFQAADLFVPSERHSPVGLRKTGIYFLLKHGVVVYVGQSVDIFGRIGQHHKNGVDFDEFSYRECNKDTLDEYETAYTAVLKPKLNLKDNGQPNWFPMRGTARRISIDGIPAVLAFEGGLAANDNAAVKDAGSLIPIEKWTPAIHATVLRLKREYEGTTVEVVVGRPPHPDGDRLLVGGDVWGYGEWPKGECIYTSVLPRYKSVDAIGRVGRAYYLESAVRAFYEAA